MPISFFYFLHAVYKRGFLFGWLAFLFSYNYLLFMGFYNFTLSISFFFFSCGFWWKHRQDIQVNHLIVLYLLLLLTYLSHIASYGLLLLAISVTALCLWTSESIHQVWLERKTSGAPHMLGRFLVGLKPLVQFSLYMLPAYFVLMDYYLQSLKDHHTGNHHGMEWVVDYFWGVKSIVYFTDWHFPLHKVLLGLLGLAIVLTLIYRILRRQWLQATDPFLLLAILFTVLFIRAPWSYGPGGWINDRIHLYILLILVPWLVPDMGRFFRLGFTVAFVAICLMPLGRSTYDQARLNGEIAELTSGAHLMEAHTP